MTVKFYNDLNGAELMTSSGGIVPVPSRDDSIVMDDSKTSLEGRVVSVRWTYHRLGVDVSVRLRLS